MERCGSKTLSKLCRMRASKRLGEKEARVVFRQIAEGVKWIHNHGCCHRDLKLTNILINSQGQVKIIDFGFSSPCAENETQRMYCGTPSYMAPEMVLKQAYNGKLVDIWALAVVLYKLLTGEYAFGGRDVISLVNSVAEDDPNLNDKILQLKIEYPYYISPACVDLMQKMLVLEEGCRLTINQVRTVQKLLIDLR